MARCNLTERITIEKLETTQDEDNFEVENWQEYYKCWSGFKTVSGKEFFNAKANNIQEIVTFTIRYCNKAKALLEPGAENKFRIKYKGYYYNIIPPVSDYSNLHNFIDIRCIITT